MLTDTLGKNIAGYCGWGLLAVLVAILQDVHRQLANGTPLDPLAIIDAGIVGLLPVLIVMLGSMKQPPVGHEPLSRKAERHEARLRVTDPRADDERAAEQRIEAGLKGARGGDA